MHTPSPCTDTAAPSTHTTLDYPFAALHGHGVLQLALLLSAADPLLGGVLIEGPRGTAKTTAARALAALLPSCPKTAESPLRGLGQDAAAAFVNLPLGASLEQLTGTLDLQAALSGAGVRFQPGLLARAHGGVLYVDEVNLLPDALVDVLLDVCASGINRIERDAISHQHPARITLIGTMNPEEGPLRAQLLDRFGLHVRLGDVIDAPTREAIVRDRLRFEADPAGFCAQYAPAQTALRQRLQRARHMLSSPAHSPAIGDAIYRMVAERAHAAQPQGLRADLVMLRAARALAALEGRDTVTAQDIQRTAALALSHRATVPDPPPTTPPPHASPTPSELPTWLDASPASSATAPTNHVSTSPPSTQQPRAHSSATTTTRPTPDDAPDWGAMPAEPAPTQPPFNTTIAITQPIAALPAQLVTPKKAPRA